MAKRSEIDQLRIAINDPPDVIAIRSVADESELPAEEIPQTLFYDIARELYWAADRESSPASYRIVRLKIGDSQLVSLIDSVGVKLAECRAFEMIASRLGSELSIVKSQVGSDMTQRQSIDAMHKYYIGLAQGCRDAIDDGPIDDGGGAGGGLFMMKKPDIAGGFA